MKPVELFDLCADAVERFNRGEVHAERPFVYLTIARKKCPQGRSVRLFGRHGPAGQICNVKEGGGAFNVTALFPAVPIILALKDAMTPRKTLNGAPQP